MQYIKSYKMFENLSRLSDNELYTKIQTMDYFAEVDTKGAEFGDVIDDREISNDTKNRIIDRFPSLSIGNMNMLYIHREASTTFNDRSLRFDLDISEVDDEWFYVALHIKIGGIWTDGYYKCDQLDGVFNLIQDIYLKLEFNYEMD